VNGKEKCEVDKKTYYVSVQAGSILENQGDAAYEFEIQATEKEISQLQELFDGKDEADNDAWGRTPIPILQYHHDRPNDVYDYYLKEVFSFIHDLGTPETQKFIETMNVLTEEDLGKSDDPLMRNT
jgi:hypothetical protein